jgi:hypothetical protein
MKTFAGISAAVCASLGLATAAEYEFTVPVALAALPPEINEALVRCEIYTPRTGGGLDVAGSGETRQPIAGGAFRGDVRVNVDRSALMRSRVPSQWTCYLRVQGTVGGARAEFWAYDDPVTGAYGLKTPPGVATRVEIPALAGAPKTVTVSGAF